MVAAPIATDAIIGAFSAHGATPFLRQHFHDALLDLGVIGLLSLFRFSKRALKPRMLKITRLMNESILKLPTRLFSRPIEVGQFMMKDPPTVPEGTPEIFVADIIRLVE